MLHLSSNTLYYFYNKVVDMRKGVYGLCGIVNNEILYSSNKCNFLGIYEGFFFFN